MSAVALIKFTQGATVGTAGVAQLGIVSSIVTVQNGSVSDIASWQIDVIDAPTGSVVPVTTIAYSNSGNTPSATFTPDITGSYRIRLQVWDVVNRVGTVKDTDIRVFAIPELNSFIVPPYQAWPQQLPPTQSGATGNKPDEMNFAGQTKGWGGTGEDGLLNDLIKSFGTSAAFTLAGTYLNGATDAAQTLVLSTANSPLGKGLVIDSTQGGYSSGTFALSILQPDVSDGITWTPSIKVNKVGGLLFSAIVAGPQTYTYEWLTAVRGGEGAALSYILQTTAADGIPVDSIAVDSGSGITISDNHNANINLDEGIVTITSDPGWHAVMYVGNLELQLGGTVGSVTSDGVGVIKIANCITPPPSTPSGGGVLYVEGGALKFKGSSGTVTTIAPA